MTSSGKKRRWTSLLLGVLPLGSSAAVAGDAVLEDVAGGKDSPIASRFAGSVPVGYEDRSFGSERRVERCESGSAPGLMPALSDPGTRRRDRD